MVVEQVSAHNIDDHIYDLIFNLPSGEPWTPNRVAVSYLELSKFSITMTEICNYIHKNWFIYNYDLVYGDPLLDYPDFHLNGKYLWSTFNTIYFSDKEDLVRFILMR